MSLLQQRLFIDIPAEHKEANECDYEDKESQFGEFERHIPQFLSEFV